MCTVRKSCGGGHGTEKLTIMSKTWKSSENTVPSKKVKLLECILHVSGIDNGKFSTFRDIKVKVAENLSSLHQIHDK